MSRGIKRRRWTEEEKMFLTEALTKSNPMSFKGVARALKRSETAVRVQFKRQHGTSKVKQAKTAVSTKPSTYQMLKINDLTIKMPKNSTIEVEGVVITRN